jgi:hypothetical protein
MAGGLDVPILFSWSQADKYARSGQFARPEGRAAAAIETGVRGPKV